MSSVHYKFKATLEYKTLTFDGIHIGVDELKKAICEKENIRTESFDLLLTNAHTKREYTSGGLVPRNSSVIVQRLPRENASKLPKVQDTSTSGIVQRGALHQPSSSYINPSDFAKMTEEQRLAHVKHVSTEKYSAAHYQRRPTRIMEGPPPPTYICNRCSQPGHWNKNCPLVNTKKTTGIPMEELMETTADDPNAMLHPSGRFVKPIMHYQARLQRKHEPFPGHSGVNDGGGSPYTKTEEQPVPDQYKCIICQGILRDAVLAACCGHSFCAECYQQKLLANPNDICPGPDCSERISGDSFIPNKSLRTAIQKYVSDFTDTGSAMDYSHQGIEQSSGVNKPSVLTDTQSLLHKLMPDLAYAQAKRELATAGRSPTFQERSSSSTLPVSFKQSISLMPMPPSSQPSNRAETMASTHVFDAKLPPQSAVAHPLSQIPEFDPKKPPPPIPVQSKAVPSEMRSIWENFLKREEEESSVRKSTAPTIPTFLPIRNVGKSPIVQEQVPSSSSTLPVPTKQPQPMALMPMPPPPSTQPSTHPATSAPIHDAKMLSLSAKEMTSIWENFLKRKEEESALKKGIASTTPKSHPIRQTNHYSHSHPKKKADREKKDKKKDEEREDEKRHDRKKRRHRNGSRKDKEDSETDERKKKKKEKKSHHQKSEKKMKKKHSRGGIKRKCGSGKCHGFGW